MSLKRPTLVTCVALAASAVAACQKPNPEPTRKTIGHAVTRLGVRVGGTWISGYSVEVAPQEYVMVEHKNCPDAKEARSTKDDALGICVFGITKEQSDQFEKAMAPFKRYAVPLQSVSMEDPWVRPDGKPCKSNVLDTTLVTLTWT